MSVVAIAKGTGYEAAVKALHLTGFKQFAKGKKRIVIKPNLVVPVHSSKGITTDVNVVRAVLDCLPDCSKAVIAEGAFDTSETFKLDGYDKLASEYGVELVDLEKEAEWKEVKVKEPFVLKSIKMAKRVVESDFVVSVGKLKIHSQTTVTGAMKNMMGACPKDQRLRIHSYLPKSLIDLLSVKMPDFGVIDGIVANEMDENVPYPIRMNIVLAGEDCVALDRTATDVMCINPLAAEYIKMAFERGFGEFEAKIVGESIEDVKKTFRTRGFSLRSDGQRIGCMMLIEIGAFEWFYKNIFPTILKINRKIKIL